MFNPKEGLEFYLVSHIGVHHMHTPPCFLLLLLFVSSQNLHPPSLLQDHALLLAPLVINLWHPAQSRANTSLFLPPHH